MARRYGRGLVMSPVEPRGWRGYQHPVAERVNPVKKVRAAIPQGTLKRLQREAFEAAQKKT